MDLSALVRPDGGKIVLIVMDGLGGFADTQHGTEAEEATTPNLDRLVADGVTGLGEPVGPGITPGSGPGHLALFGYDPEVFELGRGALSAAGLEFKLSPGDVAARGNLCTLDSAGVIADRRAGRLPDGEARQVVELLADKIAIDGCEVVFRHEREHRVLVVLRGEGLDPRLADTDPQVTGVAPLAPNALDPAAERTASVVAELDAQVRAALSDQPKANGLLLRGFDQHRDLPGFKDRYGLKAAAIAIYPMYRGIARLLGMDVLGAPDGLDEQLGILSEAWGDYDYFFFHHKATDSAGEDGDRPRKIAAIETLDAAVPAILDLGPDVVMVSGDHATPTQMAAHSWHPVPIVLWGSRVGRDDSDRFGERWCRHGGLGTRPMKTMMPILLANAGRLQKYGA
ncbi:MAG: 2,3-bisphosphoglycerate-independent phosphoglycerate mutase [Acidimicrobiia bacterium]